MQNIYRLIASELAHQIGRIEPCDDLASPADEFVMLFRDDILALDKA